MASILFIPGEMEQKLMTTPEQNTCAHVPCTCVVESGKKYCGESCSDAGSGDVEIACECGHATCSTSIEEVA
jgi:hypothetical protein